MFLLSFSIGISCHAVESEEEFCKELDITMEELFEAHGEFFDKRRKYSGGSMPGKAADSLFQNYDKKDENGEEARRRLRAYSERIIRDYPDLLKLWVSQGEKNGKIKRNL